MRKKSYNFQASPGDEELLAEICERLGVGNGEAIRTSIRVYAAILKQK